VRVLAQPVELGNGRTGILAVTRPIQELQDTLLHLGVLLAGAVALLAVVVAVLAYRLAGRALRPVRLIAATARDLSEHDLHRRLAMDLPNDELGELASTFNGMLARLEAAFRSLQQFTADAAHELRAPLALLRAELEVSLRRVRTPAEYQVSQQVALAEVERLAALVDRLLMLARADAGALDPRFEEVDLGDLIEETVERWRPLADLHDVETRAEVRREGIAIADPDLLRRLVDNLLDNAVRHTPAGGTVIVSVDETDAGWEIAVADTGPGIPPDQRDSLFERFSRGDASRARATGGAGLGLALCTVIAELHGGWIDLDDTVAHGARLRMSLPRSARSGDLSRERV
jgi:heavy metal sensor kinase